MNVHNPLHQPQTTHYYHVRVYKHNNLKLYTVRDELRFSSREMLPMALTTCDCGPPSGSVRLTSTVHAPSERARKLPQPSIVRRASRHFSATSNSRTVDPSRFVATPDGQVFRSATALGRRESAIAISFLPVAAVVAYASPDVIMDQRKDTATLDRSIVPR